MLSVGSSVKQLVDFRGDLSAVADALVSAGIQIAGRRGRSDVDRRHAVFGAAGIDQHPVDQNVVVDAHDGQLAAAAELRGKKERIIWVLEGDSLRPLRVKTGLNDGIVTEISGDGLEEGMQVVTGTSVISAEQAAADNPGGSPFLPKPPQRRNRK